MNGPLASVAALALGIGGVVGWYLNARRRSPAPLKGDPTIKAMGWILTMLGLFSVGYVFVNTNIQTRQQDCQYDVNAALIQVLSTRQDAANTKDAALKDMAQKILDSQQNEARRLAIKRFIDSMSELQQTRSENPYPNISRCR